MGFDAGFQEARRLRRQGAEFDQVIDGVGVPGKFTDGQRGAVESQWRDHGVDPGAIRQPAVDHRGVVVDAAPDEGRDVTDHPDKLGVAGEAHLGQGELALALDIDLVGAVDHHFADAVIEQERRQRAVIVAFQCAVERLGGRLERLGGGVELREVQRYSRSHGAENTAASLRQT